MCSHVTHINQFNSVCHCHLAKHLNLRPQHDLAWNSDEKACVHNICNQSGNYLLLLRRHQESTKLRGRKDLWINSFLSPTCVPKGTTSQSAVHPRWVPRPGARSLLLVMTKKKKKSNLRGLETQILLFN